MAAVDSTEKAFSNRWREGAEEILSQEKPVKMPKGLDQESTRTNPTKEEYQKRAIDAGKFIAEMTPIIGDAMAAKEVYDEIQREDTNWLYVGALGGAAVIGLIPGLGDAAAKLIKKGAEKALDIGKRVEVDPNALGSTGGNLRLKPKEFETDTVKAAGLTDEDIAKFRKPESEGGRGTSPEFREALKGRNPILQELAKKLKEGKITKQEYWSRADEIRPIRLVSEVPKPATNKEIVSALNSKQRQNPLIGLNATIPEKDIVEVRLNIPAYTDYNVWIPTIRHNKKEKYKAAIKIQNVKFIQPDSSGSKKALNVATGVEKSPFAVMTGEYVDGSDDELFNMAKGVFDSDEWTQVGYDPIKRGFFYDRATGEAVLEADEVIQVGHLVLAKNAKKTDPDAFSFNKGGLPIEQHLFKKPIKAHKGTVVYDEPEGFSPESFDPTKQETEEKKDTETKPFENPLIEPPEQISIPKGLESITADPASIYDPASEVGNPTVPIKEPEKKDIFVAPENPFVKEDVKKSVEEVTATSKPKTWEDIHGPPRPILLDNKPSVGLANPNAITQLPPLRHNLQQQYEQDFQKWRMLKNQTLGQNPQYQALKLAGDKFQNAMQEELAPYDLKMQAAQKALEEGNMSFGDFMGIQQEMALAVANAEQKHMGLQAQAKIAAANFENSQWKEFNEQYKNLSANTINALKYNKGGMMEQQMSLFEEGGMKDDGLKKDPVSGNDIPPGSLAKEVRDDIPAQLSDGEYVVPADVVQYFGVKFFEDLRMEAKRGLAEMDATGRIGGEPVSMTMIAIGEAEKDKKKKALGGPVGYANGGVSDDMQQIEKSRTFNPADYAVLGFTPVSPVAQTGQTSQQGVTRTVTYYHGETGESRVVTFVGGVVTPPTDLQYTQPPWSTNKPSPTKVEEKKQERDDSKDPEFISTSALASDPAFKDMNAKAILDKNGNVMTMTKQGYGAVLTSANRLGLDINEYYNLPMSTKAKLVGQELKSAFGGKIDESRVDKIIADAAEAGPTLFDRLISFGKSLFGIDDTETSTTTPPSGKPTPKDSTTTPTEPTTEKKNDGIDEDWRSDADFFDAARQVNKDKQPGQKATEESKTKTADENIAAGDYSFLNKGGLATRTKRRKKK